MVRIFVILLLMIIPPTKALGEYERSDHYDGTKFHNPRNHSLKSFWDLLKWKLTAKKATWPSWVENKQYELPLIQDSQAKAIVTFVNHATFLLQFPELNILTDPIFSERTSPFSFIGPKRVRDPGVAFDKLPPIDVVLVSHNHYDHLDITTLKKLEEKFSPLFLVPLGNKDFLKNEGLKNVQELDWWDEVDFKNYRITLTPAYHWSARSFFDKCETLWGAFLIKSTDYSIYFAGDTGLEDHFKETKAKLGAPDLALLPIGSWAPRWFMKNFHMDPAEAVEAHLDLGAAKSIGMHFGTFQLTDEGYYESQEILKRTLEEKKLSKEFLLLDQGESFIVNEDKY